MKNTKKFITWALTIFMIVSSIAFTPSISSVIMLAFAVIAAPIDSWQELLSGMGIRGRLKGVVLCVAFIVAMVTAPVKDSTRTVDFPDVQPSYHGTLPSKAPTQTDPPAASKAGSDTPAPTQAPSESVPTKPSPVQSQAPAPTPSKKPTPTETQVPQNSEPSVSLAPTVPSAKQTQAPAQSGNQSGSGQGDADNFDTWDNPNQQNTSAKWVLNTSTLKIHYPRCSDVARIAPQNYSTFNLSEEELLRQGFTPCGRCH